MQHLLVQKLMIDGQEIDISLMLSMTYIETLSLDGPRFIITFNDMENIIRDDSGLAEKSVITIVMQDQHLQGGLDITEDVVIRSVTANDNGNLVAQGFPIAVDEAKKPATRTCFMINQSALAIGLAMMPSAPVITDPFTQVEQFHLLAGERPTRKLRKLSRELGAAIYYQRGFLNIKSLQGLFMEPIFDTYHYNNEGEEAKIVTYKSLYRDSLASELIHKHYNGWNINDGHLQATRNNGQPVEILPLNTLSQLDNQNWVLLPVIDFGTHGRGALKPGLTIGLKFHRAREGRPFDESLPEKVLIYLVAHHYEANSYKCRVKAGVVKNARD